MVTFTSLFLWLMTGIHPVMVAVDPVVSSVEIFLDGESVGIATEPDWEVTCDFGQRLRPHELLAVARDARGREIGRASQLVNLPRADAEVAIVFEGDSPEKPTMARVITESAERLEPLAVYVTFDGVLLRQGVDGLYRLPSYDHRRAHIVSAEARFPEGVTARRDVTFGGLYGERLTTELTAIPVVVDKKRKLKVSELRGVFRACGEILRVAAVEREGGRVYMVRDHGVWPMLRNTGRMIDRRNRSIRFFHHVRIGDEIPPQKDKFYLVVPNPTPSRGLSLFPILRPIEIEKWGMPWLTTHIASQQATVPGQRLAEAVAVAGLRAAAGGCPRAVVLVLGDDPVDFSWFQPAVVREYLRDLHVPLVVWSTSGSRSAELWGGFSEKTTGLSSLGKASQRLLKSLDRQWIVWVEGRHLPHEIEVAENDCGFRLAG
jgi:hypothetical protein